MEYTSITLFGLGLVGVLAHNLIKMNEINRQMEGNIDLLKYFKLERFSIILSVIVVGAAVVVSNEVKELTQAGKWLGIGFIAIGYMAQSIMVALGGKAQKIIGKDDSNG